MPRKRAAPAKRHIAAPGLDRLAVISAELTEAPARARGARGAAGTQAVEAEGRAAKRQRVTGPGQEDCSTAEEARVMSMYLHRSMQQLSQLNADLSVLWPIINSKQFLTCQEHEASEVRENSPAGANLPQTQQQPSPQSHLAPIYQELLRLRATLEGIIGRHVPIPVPSANGIDMGTIFQSFRAIQLAADTLQQQLSQRPNPEETKARITPALDRLWTQSRLAAEEEMREKLYLWKYKALDLKQSLQATIASRTNTTASSPKQSVVSSTNLDDTRTLNVLRSALDFVSSLYLLEVVNDPSSNPTNFRKERAMSETAFTVGEKIYEVQLEQRTRVTAPAALFSTPVGHPSFAPIYQPLEQQPQPFYPQYSTPQPLQCQSEQGLPVAPLEESHQQQVSQRRLQQPQQQQQPLIAPDDQVLSNGIIHQVHLQQPPLLTPSSAPVNAFDPNFSDASDPPEEDEPLPMVAPIQSSANDKDTLEVKAKAPQDPERVKTANKQIPTPTSTHVQASAELTARPGNGEVPRVQSPSAATRRKTPGRSTGSGRSRGKTVRRGKTGTTRKQHVGQVERGAVEAVAAAAAARIMGGSGSKNQRKSESEVAKTENELPAKVDDAKTATSALSQSVSLNPSSRSEENMKDTSDVPPGQGKSIKTIKLPHRSMLYGGVITPHRAPVVLLSDDDSDGNESSTDEAENSDSAENDDENRSLQDLVSATDSGSSTPTSASGSSAQRGVSTGCSICQKNDSYAQLLLCDNDCGREYHTFCLSPPLSNIPEGDWYCPRCLSVEQVENGNIFKCSASNCDKITGARYCSLHRCREPHCLNRIKAGGFCRRHELFRSRPKRARPPPASQIVVRSSDAADTADPDNTSQDASNDVVRDAVLPIPINSVKQPNRVRTLAPGPPPEKAPETSTELSTRTPTDAATSTKTRQSPARPKARATAPSERPKVPLKNILPKRTDAPQSTDSSEQSNTPQRSGTAVPSEGSSHRANQRSGRTTASIIAEDNTRRANQRSERTTASIIAEDNTQRANQRPGGPRTTASIIAAAKTAADKAAAERAKSATQS